MLEKTHNFPQIEQTRTLMTKVYFDSIIEDLNSYLLIYKKKICTNISIQNNTSSNVIVTQLISTRMHSHYMRITVSIYILYFVIFVPHDFQVQQTQTQLRELVLSAQFFVAKEC